MGNQARAPFETLAWVQESVMGEPEVKGRIQAVEEFEEKCKIEKAKGIQKNNYRNLFQVAAADSVYVVSWRSKAWYETGIMDIGGGTGAAARSYLTRFGEARGKQPIEQCQLYLYDISNPDGPYGGSNVNNPSERHTWLKWTIQKGDNTKGSWVSCEDRLPPVPANMYAGIGGLDIGTVGEKAIKALYSQNPLDLPVCDDSHSNCH